MGGRHAGAEGMWSRRPLIVISGFGSLLGGKRLIRHSRAGALLSGIISLTLSLEQASLVFRKLLRFLSSSSIGGCFGVRSLKQSRLHQAEALP